MVAYCEAGDEGELVEAGEEAADAARCVFGDVERVDGGGDADGDAGNETGDWLTFTVVIYVRMG